MSLTIKYLCGQCKQHVADEMLRDKISDNVTRFIFHCSYCGLVTVRDIADERLKPAFAGADILVLTDMSIRKR